MLINFIAFTNATAITVDAIIATAIDTFTIAVIVVVASTIDGVTQAAALGLERIY